jgi:hypothetical protein
MMASLTSFLPMLVSHLGITQAAIYERQRALIRLGLLPKPVGRGRGSGVDATPQSTGLIIISTLATDNLSDMDDRILALCRAQVREWRKRKECRLTKQTVFHHALAEILASHALAKRVLSVDVERRSLEASIYWEQKVSQKVEVSKFVENEMRADSPSSLEVTASLHGTALRQIAAMLTAEKLVRSGPEND